MAKLVIFPYLLGSRSAKELAQALSTKQVRPDGRYRPRPSHVVVNWGNSREPTAWRTDRWLNAPSAVSLASNKLAAFQRFKEAGVPTPAFTSSPEEAQAWDKTIVVRHQLSGHSGAGIEFGEAGALPPPAPLYTEYLGKRAEYRVHVFRDQVIDRQAKLRRNGLAEDAINWKVRNHDTGWVYARGVPIPDSLDSISIAAIRALGLDFGAVDLVVTNGRRNNGQVKVLEINTAPGLVGTTLRAYNTALEQYVRAQPRLPNEGGGIGIAAVHRRVRQRGVG